MQHTQMKDPKLLLQRGAQLLSTGKLADANEICQYLMSHFSYSSTVLSFAAQVAMARKQFPTAEKLLLLAIEKKPEHPQFHLLLANCLLVLGWQDKAIACAKRALEIAPDNLKVLSIAGTFLVRCAQNERAHQAFLHASELSPNDPSVLYNLATTHRFMGNFQAVENICDKLLQLGTTHYEALFLRSDVRKQTLENNHIADLESRLAAGVTGLMNEVHLHYALAKEYEDISEYQKSFAILIRGSNLRRSNIQYNVQRDLDIMSDIRQHYSAEFIASKITNDTNDTNDTSGPIFILGMPRTGTTLLERVISSHSEVVSAGELNEFGILMNKQTQLLGGTKPVVKEAMVETSLNLDFKRLGELYIQATQFHTKGSPYFIDKLPFNFLYCGLIHLAIPNAKIIHLTRHPMDTCYSVYKMMFNQAYPFSYDLDELAQYYVAYRQLMDHWHQVMPGKILDVSYEAMTENLAEEARKVLQHCGLDWQDQVLEFHQQQTASTTASASQVRQPVYKSSVAKWKHYREQLQPVAKILRDNGIDIPE